MLCCAVLRACKSDFVRLRLLHGVDVTTVGMMVYVCGICQSVGVSGSGTVD